MPSFIASVELRWPLYQGVERQAGKAPEMRAVLGPPVVEVTIVSPLRCAAEAVPLFLIAIKFQPYRMSLEEPCPSIS